MKVIVWTVKQLVASILLRVNVLSYAPYDLQPWSKRIPPCKSHYFTMCTRTLHPVLHARVLEKKMTLNIKFFPAPPENDSLPIISPTEFNTGISKSEDYVI